MLALPDAAAQERLAQRIVAEGLSVRAVEEIVTLGESGSAAPRRRSARTLSARATELATVLSDHFETRVRVDQGKSKGRITIEFASAEDLERIIATMQIDRSSDLST